MYRISNFTDNDDVKVLAKLGAFEVIEYKRDSRIGSNRLLLRADECEKAPAGMQSGSV